MSLKLNSSGSGSVTLQEPVTASNRTLNLPDVDATVITNRTAGTVLQVVQATINSTQSTTTTGSYVASNLTASITPSSASNKILVMLTGGNVWNNSNNFGVIWTFQRSIGGGAYSDIAGNPLGIIQNVGATGGQKSSWSGMFLDSPATTSTITYQPYYRANGGGTAYFNEATVIVQLTLLEIAA